MKKRKIDYFTQSEIDFLMHKYWHLRKEVNLKKEFDYLLGIRRNKYCVPRNINDADIIAKIKDLEPKLLCYAQSL